MKKNLKTFTKIDKIQIDEKLFLEYEAKKMSQRYVMLCTIWYHLHNLKNAKNTHGGVLLLVKLQAKSLQLY